MDPLSELEELRREIGARLRSLRESHHIEQVQLARQLGFSQSKVSRIETGHLTPSVEDVKAFLGGVGARRKDQQEVLDALSRLHTDLRSYRALTRRGRRNVQQEIAEQEAASTHIRSFQHALIPGLLQTAAYAKAVMSTKPDPHTPERLSEYLQGRIARQQALFDESKRFEFLLMEAVLWNMYAEVDVMLGQFHHLRTMMSLPNIDIAIVPLASRLEALPTAAFTIYDDLMVSVETPTLQVQARDEEDVAHFVRLFDLLREAASTGDEAKDLLERHVAAFRERMHRPG
jgi:transcriptional regulator with XRE-family HTH domain